MSEKRETGPVVRPDERCVCCGEIIPEGIQVCSKCAGHGYQYRPPRRRLRDRIRDAIRAFRE